MTTPELLEFIRIEHALGMSLSEITHLLISEGEWDIADVAEAFRALGLPEEAVESFSTTKKNEEFKEIMSAPKIVEKKDEIIHHAPAPTGATSPRNIEYQRRAAPMHYVEQPEEAPKPTLAKPASLSGQVSRNLVRTVSTAASYAKVQKPKSVEFDHNGASVHISKLGKEGVINRDIAGPANNMGAPLPKPKEVSGSISDIERALSLGIEMPGSEPKPKSVAAPFKNESIDKPTPISNFKIGLGGEIKDAENIISEPKVEVKDIKPEEKKEVISEVKNEITKPEIKPEEKIITPPVDLPIKEEVLPTAQNTILETKPEVKTEPIIEEKKEEKKEEIKVAPITPTPVPEIIPPKVENVEAPKIEPVLSVEKPKVVEPEVKTAQAVEPVIATPPVQPPPAQPQQPQQYAQPQYQPQYQIPPQYIQQAPPQIIMQQPQPYYTQPQMGGMPTPPQSPQPKSMLTNEPRMEEIGSVAPDIEEQAYLAQFGQAPMPAGIQRPQPTYVSPTIIYAQQVVTQAPPSAAANAPEEKKPEPMRFDIGKIRTAHKTDQTAYTGRPSVISAVTGMKPVESKTLEDTFNEKLSMKSEDNLMSLEKKDAIHSLKVPHKRTMMSDLVNVQVGVLPGQVVSQAVKEGEVGSVSSNVATIIDEEPIPPPPPKKSSKTMLLITSFIAIAILIGGAVGYYFIVLRLPSASEVYSNALGVILRGPAVSYEATVLVSGTSTTAEPEYLNVNAYASGTLAINSKAFQDGIYYAKVVIDHNGIPSPINLDYEGDIIVDDEMVYVSQKYPTLGTPIENLLKEGEWIKTPYKDFGMLMGFTNPTTVTEGEYGTITPSTSIFKMFTVNSPLVVDGGIQKISENGRELYKIPLKIDSKRAILLGDLLSKYLRGSSATVTSAERSEILEARYNEIKGELIVDKLLMKPLRISLEGKFDSSKMPMDGSVKINMSFNIFNQIPNPDVKAKTLDELKAQRLEESLSQSIIAKDAPVNAIVPVVNLALKQYFEKFGRYPVELNDLISAGFIGKDSMTQNISDRIFYSSYVEKPEGPQSGIRCTAKNVKCGFYHFGANLEFRKSTDLENDSDFESSVIDGKDEAGCHKEPNYACLDYIIDSNVK